MGEWAPLRDPRQLGDRLTEIIVGFALLGRQFDGDHRVLTWGELGEDFAANASEKNRRQALPKQVEVWCPITSRLPSA